jgi:hypothetical protein
MRKFDWQPFGIGVTAASTGIATIVASQEIIGLILLLLGAAVCIGTIVLAGTAEALAPAVHTRTSLAGPIEP